MRKATLTCALCFALLGQVSSASQVPQITPKDAPKRGDTITVEGCIDGKVLTERDSNLVYQLEGDKPMIQHINSEHQEHSDKVTGRLKSERLIGSVKQKTFGKTTVRIGAREQRTQLVGAREVLAMQEPADRERGLDPVLEVTAIEHIKAGCTR